MKALSLWQPWASLVAWEEKTYETRHWSTKYRGLLAIHAAKRPVTEATLGTINRNFIDRAMQAHHATFPVGAVLCIVRLVDVVPAHIIYPDIEDKERAFGNYSSGRYAWSLELIECFDKPIPAIGRQGLFNWERE